MPGSKTVCGFYIISILKGYEVLKSKRLCILLNRNLDFDEKESEMGNSTHSFRGTNLVLQLI